MYISDRLTMKAAAKATAKKNFLHSVKNVTERSSIGNSVMTLLKNLMISMYVVVQHVAVSLRNDYLVSKLASHKLIGYSTIKASKNVNVRYSKIPIGSYIQMPYVFCSPSVSSCGPQSTFFSRTESHPYQTMAGISNKITKNSKKKTTIR